MSRSSQSKHSRQRRINRQSEVLEVRRVLDATASALLNDTFSARSDGETLDLDVLANDAPGQQVVSVSQGSLGGYVAISEDGLTVRYTPFPGAFGTETFIYAVASGGTATVSVSLTARVADDTFELLENPAAPVLLSVLANDDLGDDYTGAGVITAVSFASSGAELEIASDGRSINYTPIDGFKGTDTFVYIIDDLYAATVTVNLRAVLQNDSFDAAPEQSSALDVLHNDFLYQDLPLDYTGDRVITRVTDPTSGAVSIHSDGQSLIYTPQPGHVGYDSFHYVVDGLYNAQVSVYTRPGLTPDYVNLDADSEDFNIYVLRNDELPDALITDVTPPPSGGTIRIASNQKRLIYTPPVGFTGNDRVTYTVNGLYHSTLSINVQHPVRDDHLVTTQDSGAVLLDVLENDSIGNGYQGPLRITSVEQPLHGVVVIVGDIEGSYQYLTYTPNPGFAGPDYFEYEVDHEFTATVSVSVRNSVIPDYYTRVIDPGFSDIRLPVLSNDYTSGLISAVTQPEHGGSVQIAGDQRSLILTPDTTEQVNAEFSYTVNGQYTTTVRVALYPHTKLLNDYSVVDQNGDGVVIDVLENDRFGSAGQTVYISEQRAYGPTFEYLGPQEITAVGDSEHGGLVTISADQKTVLYTPPDGYSGSDSFTYEVDGVWSGHVDVSIVRRIRDDEAAVLALSGESQINVLANDSLSSDYLGAGLISEVSSTTAGGTVRISDDGRSVFYTAPENYTGTDTFEYTIDGRQTATVTVQVAQSVEDLINRFGSVEAVKEWLIEDAVQRNAGLFGTPVNYFYYDYSDSFSGVTSRIASADSGATTFNFSDTNVQVGGVDEADLIENDGEHLYVLNGSSLTIVKAFPADEMVELSRVRISGTPVGMYLHEGRLTVISTQATPTYSARPTYDFIIDVDPILPVSRTFTLSSPLLAARDVSDRIYLPRDFRTLVTIFDVSDPANPELIRDTALDARYVESRSIDGLLHLVLQSQSLQLPGPQTVEVDDSLPPVDESDASDVLRISFFPSDRRYETEAEYLARLESEIDGILANILPGYTTTTGNGEVISGSLVDLAETAAFGESASSPLTTVLSLDTTSDDPTPVASETLLAQADSEIYATAEHLYIFSNGFANGSAEVQIRQFSWDNEAGGLTLSGIGSVAGAPLDQFSFDEHDGLFRIATSVSRETPTGTRNVTDITILENRAGLLQPVGSLLDVGRGSALKSVRFMGDQAFAATFSNSSPMFVLDLSDSTAPTVTGQVRSIGFPSYIQMIDATHLLTVGRSATPQVTGPTQVSLYDISDPANPILLDRDPLPLFSSSIAESEHHAFGWFGVHNTLAIPTNRSYSQPVDRDGDGIFESTEWVYENSLVAFQIDTSFTGRSEDAISVSGTVDHDRTILRSAFIGDVLYSIGVDQIRAVDIQHPDTLIGDVDLAYVEIVYPYPRPVIYFTLDAADFARSEPLASALSALVESASVTLVDGVITADLSALPATTIEGTVDGSTDELVLSYFLTGSDDAPVERRFPLDDVTGLSVALGAGDDSATFSSLRVPVTVSGGDGDDTISGGRADDSLDGGAGNDALSGKSGRDTLSGGTGNDRLRGQGSGDRIDGGEGIDFIDGGAGLNDLIDQVAGQLAITIRGYASSRGDRAVASGEFRTVELTGSDGVDNFDATRFYGENLILDGAAGDDSIAGSPGDDMILGGGGNDRLRGGGGNDFIQGGTGNDRVSGQGGNDTIGGGLGDDRLDGGSGRTILQEEVDISFTVSSSGSETRLSGLGRDRLTGIFHEARLVTLDTQLPVNTDNFTGRVTVAGERSDGAANELSLELLNGVIADLSQRTGRSADAIELLGARHVVWPDASLGMSTSGSGDAQVLTPGFDLTLKVAGVRYSYHTSLSRFVYSHVVTTTDDTPENNDSLFRAIPLATDLLLGL
jgi:hypothetical protein